MAAVVLAKSEVSSSNESQRYHFGSTKNHNRYPPVSDLADYQYSYGLSGDSQIHAQFTADKSRYSRESNHFLRDSSPGGCSTDTPLLTESSCMSLHEMFESEGGDASELSSVPRDSLRQHEDAWFAGDGDLLKDSDNNTSFTPPLSLLSGVSKSRYPGPPTALPGSSLTSNASSGRNTPNSIWSNGTDGSLSSPNGPLLYSAIGSLEKGNAASYQQINNRLLQVREFSRLGGGNSILDKPQKSAKQKSAIVQPKPQKPVAVQPGVNGVDRADSHTRTNSTTSFTRATPQSSNQKTSNLPKLPADAESATATTTSTASNVAPAAVEAKPSNLRRSSALRGEKGNKGEKSNKRVSIKNQKKSKQVELFRPSCDAYTPRIGTKRIEYKKAEMRTPVQNMASPMGTLQRPNFRDALRRVAMIIHQHIVKIERRFEETGMGLGEKGLFKESMRDMFSEESYSTPTYKCTMVRIPMARPGMVYGLRKIKQKERIPTEEEIYEFAHQLFKAVQLSSECSIVCLIYVERLMETAKVPLMSSTWRPIFMCGLLLASKVWQDLSSWNIEFASVYPQFSLEAINRLELNFLRNVKWDLYISSSLYAKYYFALRSIVEKVDFRQRYNRMVGGVDSVAQSEAIKISKRTEQFKEVAILQLSRSM